MTDFDNLKKKLSKHITTQNIESVYELVSADEADKIITAHISKRT